MVERIIDGRIHLFADEGKVVTNGIDVNGDEIILQVGLTPEGYYEITDEEYNEILESEIEEIVE